MGSLDTEHKLQQSPGEKYREVWISYLSTFEAFRDGLSRTEQCEVLLFGKQDYSATDADRMLRKIDIEEYASNIVGILVHMAEQSFAPPHGARLAICVENYRSRFMGQILEKRGNDRDWSRFDPAAVWEALEADYGGEKGHHSAFRDLAKQIASVFSIKPGAPLDYKKGAVVLNQRIYLDRFGQKNTNAARLEHHSHEDFSRLCHNLVAFVRWATEDDEGGDGWRTALQLQQLAHEWSYHHPIESRKHYCFGNGSISLITYNTRFEWRFAPALTEKLQLFLSMYSD